jgi:hypothetical protein
MFIFSIFILAPAGLSPDANAQIFSEDLTMHSTTTSSGMMGRGGGTTTETDYYSKNAVKMATSDGTDTIIRFDSKTLVTIDNKKKTYTEMTFEQMQQMLNKLGAQLGQNAEQMEAAKKMMGLSDTSVSVSKAGAGETIAGYSTEKYLVTMGPITVEIMAAPSLKVPGAYYDALKIQAPANPIIDMNQLFDEMKKIDGIPLKTLTSIKVMNMEMKTSKVVDSIEKGAVAASVFEIPAGYKRVEPNLN